jgi:hypothetical protein
VWTQNRSTPPPPPPPNKKNHFFNNPCQFEPMPIEEVDECFSFGVIKQAGISSPKLETAPGILGQNQCNIHCDSDNTHHRLQLNT